MNLRLAAVARMASVVLIGAGLLGALAVLAIRSRDGLPFGEWIESFLLKNRNELVVGILVSVVGGAVLALGAAATSWSRSRRRAVTVRRCAVPNSEELAEVLSIYTERFGDDENYDAAELRSILSSAGSFSKDRPLPTELILFLAERQSRIKGFLLAFYYPVAQRAIIGYFASRIGSSSEAGPEEGPFSRPLVGEFARYMKKRGCDLVFYEVAASSGSQSARERNRQKGLIELFKLRAGEVGFQPAQLEINYMCPRVTNQPAAQESRALLVCIPLKEDLPQNLSKPELADILKFIYLDCYGDYYPMGTPDFESHRSYLQHFLRARLAEAPDSVVFKR